MITVFYKQNSSIHSKKLDGDKIVPPNSLWVDVESASADELDIVQKSCGIKLPSKNDVWKNNILNRLYVENGVAYMTAAIITKQDTPYPRISPVTFILTPDSLITIRDISPTSFNVFAQRLQSFPDSFQTSAQTLEALLEEMITRVAYNMEVVDDTLDNLSHRVFDGELAENGKNPSQMMKILLKELGTCADLNSKTNESLQSINRLLHFFKQTVKNSDELVKDIEVMIADTHVLTHQADFAADKISFQLDAILGMINIEQNIIMKLFSVFSVFFMPPTLVAGIYGMNFKYMPELEWLDGYPMAIAVMMTCAITPFLYFRRKKWL